MPVAAVDAGAPRDCQAWLTAQAWHQFETAEPDQANRDGTRRPSFRDQITEISRNPLSQLIWSPQVAALLADQIL
ncbi:hypothetical protein [Streptomyces inhibens]|uniref:hypothetical protein n=1 Tax=Streptomyces inhibens TaxID=2293571 RepID=UPI001EE69E38|nr:hypothetical protein [Streptomyces inhibens]UKY54887.1 hypothetical protein KI385_43095 [Streptomyces inhibens]